MALSGTGKALVTYCIACLYASAVEGYSMRHTPIERQQIKSSQNRHSLQQGPQDIASCCDAVRAGPVLQRCCTPGETCFPRTWCHMGSLSTCSRQVCCATSPMPQAGARPSAAQAARLAQLHWQPPLRVQETLPYLKGCSSGESNTTHLRRAFGLLCCSLGAELQV